MTPRRSHGGRASDMEKGTSVIDIAFIAAPTSDDMGNCTGKFGKSACGSIGYAFADAMNAKKVVVITDNLVEYPLVDFSIPEVYVDYVVALFDKRGQFQKIVNIMHKEHDDVDKKIDTGVLCDFLKRQIL